MSDKNEERIVIPDPGMKRIAIAVVIFFIVLTPNIIFLLIFPSEPSEKAKTILVIAQIALGIFDLFVLSLITVELLRRGSILHGFFDCKKDE
ncbi:MAG TPA: hypothetical protein ENI70_00360 [Candidatus Peregrinibacteria bacterium]|nr:hypothetical protein [Candidatus Peregrinibacteria bacterium]